MIYNKVATSNTSLLQAYARFFRLLMKEVPSMWFWSVSWSTNCPVYFTLFLVDQKKICSVSGNFWSGSDFFGQPNFFLVYQNFFLVYQKIRAWPKKIQRLTKNSLRLNNFIFGRPRKVRNRPDNWSTKRLTKTTWTGLLSFPEKKFKKHKLLIIPIMLLRFQ